MENDTHSDVGDRIVVFGEIRGGANARLPSRARSRRQSARTNMAIELKVRTVVDLFVIVITASAASDDCMGQRVFK